MIEQTLRYVCSHCGDERLEHSLVRVGVPGPSPTTPGGWTAIDSSELVCDKHTVRVYDRAHP